MHWAFRLIGLPWSPGGEGPDDFYCWGLVQHVFRERHNVEMPPMRFGEDKETNVGAIKHASQVSGWRLVDGSLEEDDIVLMRGITGRHVGIAIKANRHVGVLHANGGYNLEGQPYGAVAFQTLDELTLDGFFDFEYWRRADRV